MSRQDRIAQLMALLNDAESSGDDDKIIEIKSDIFKEFGIEKNMGGMASMDDMTRPVGYENGGNVTRRLSSTRAKKPFEDFLRDIGFTKKDEKTGKLRGAKGDWAKYLTSKNIKVGSAEATDELNNLLKAAGKPTYIDIKTAGKNFSEDIISAITGTEPGERGARDIRNATNSKIVEIKKVATQAEGANSTKAKQKLLTTLFEKSFPVLKQVPKYATLLSTAIASKAFGYMPIATEMGDAELPKESMKDQVMKNMDFSGPSANAQLLEQMSQDAAMNKRGGGMMNMDEMIRPLGYKRGTRDGNLVGDREKMYSAPPPDPKDPDDLDLIINNMTFHVLHDKNRPMKENITRENYFNILPEEEQQIAEQLRMQLGISSDSPQYEYIRNKIIEEADKINKIRQEEAQPVSTKLLKGSIKGVGSLFNKMFGSKGD
jgi:SLT domain-containing protein